MNVTEENLWESLMSWSLSKASIDIFKNPFQVSGSTDLSFFLPITKSTQKEPK